MEDAQALINKVEQSGLVTLDPASFSFGNHSGIRPKATSGARVGIDGEAVQEAIKNTDWSVYQGKTVGITCTADALIPLWAYMLVVSQLQPIANRVLYGNEIQVQEQLLLEAINLIDPTDYKDAKVVVKGCGDRQIPAAAFVALTAKLRPVVKSIMYGEPCSTVPVYKTALTKI